MHRAPAGMHIMYFYCCCDVQAPEDSMKERVAATKAAGKQRAKQRASTAYLPIRISPNGMQPIIIAGVLFHEMPQIVSMFNASVGNALSGFLRTTRWYPILYGLVVFLASILDMADSTPKQMTEYLNAVRFKRSGPHSSTYMLQEPTGRAS